MGINNFDDSPYHKRAERLEPPLIKKREPKQCPPGIVQSCSKKIIFLKDVPGGFPKSDLLGVTVALIHVVGQQFLAV